MYHTVISAGVGVSLFIPLVEIHFQFSELASWFA